MIEGSHVLAISVYLHHLLEKEEKKIVKLNDRETDIRQNDITTVISSNNV